MWSFSLSSFNLRIILNFIHAFARIIIILFILLINSPFYACITVNWSFLCFQLLAVADKAPVIICVLIFASIQFSWIRLGYMGYMMDICFTFSETIKLFLLSWLILHSHSGIWEFQLLHILVNFWCYQSF